jgi:hypothetical protein
MTYNHRTGYRFPVQARDRLRRYDVRRFRQLKSLVLGDKLWAGEAEDRLDAYDQGRIKAISLESVLQKYR